MLFFLREKARSRRCKLLTFANVFLRDSSSFNSLILLFLNLSKELIIDYLIKNANNVKDVNKKTRLKMFENASLFRWAIRTSLRCFKTTIKLKDSRFRMLSK